MEPSRRASLTLFFLPIPLLILIAMALPSMAWAEEEITPSTAVARLKIVKGTAWVRPADSLEWEEYSHNFPVVERARVSIPARSEAEIQFRGSQYLLLEGGSEVDVLQLGERKVTFRHRAGKAAFSLSKEDFAPVKVKVSGNRDVSLDAPGLYWLTVDGEATKLNVRRGEGTVSGEGMSPVAVKGGEEASIGKEVQVAKAAPPETGPAPEALTEAEREAGVPQSAATELRGYGSWVWTSEYGYVWRPTVAEDWAPYYYGRWAWVYPYGWNWVGYEPWGWWPYHYGWWVSVAAWGWVWAPYGCFNNAGYYYHGYPYSYRYGYYNPANVRFANDGRHVRWVPESPGRGTSRTNAFSRTDTRLAQWNQPMARGTSASRGSGGRAPAAGGQVAASSSTRGSAGRTGGDAVTRSAAQSATRPFPEGGGRVSAVPSGSGMTGRAAGSGRSSASYTRGAGYTGYTGSAGGPRSSGSGYASPSARSYNTGSRSYGSAPGPSFNPGYRSSGPAVPSYGGGGYGGYSGGSRGYGGGFGGGWGGGSRGGGFSGGGGGRIR
ncbi:MAG: hypothetical protein H6Q84_3558 [Deltaproteobacteria bacterium]|nr:hypothetical protein [Deltaproteobacteria bacterium]